MESKPSNREAALARALAEAIAECEMHNSEYHHRTTEEKLKSWRALLKPSSSR
jgi:hypothetical protein